jgi:adenylate cyclase
VNHLLVIDRKSEQRLRYRLSKGEVVCVGRAPRSGWKVPWDRYISREHVEVLLENDRLRVKKLGSANNPIYFQEQESDEFDIVPGEHFQIGHTMFRFEAVDLVDPEGGVSELSFGRDELRRTSFGNAEHRLEVLSALPKLLRSDIDDEELAKAIVKLLLKAVPPAQTAALIAFDSVADLKSPRLMSWESRCTESSFHPSARLMGKALLSGESILHIWSEGAADVKFTLSQGLDWALCTPLRTEVCQGWCLYVAGKLGNGSMHGESAKGDVRFMELLAEFVGSFRQSRVLQQQQSSLSRFFSPAVMESLVCTDSDAMLTPREEDTTVLFCDLRGFSRQAEKEKRNLPVLLQRMSTALGVMTRGIMQHEGVIADFQGDAALAFWGWPAQLADGPLPACRAALAIHAEFMRAHRNADDSLGGFQVGIGIGHGRAIAGLIGTQEQVKVGVFGPVVNLTSRLEGLTKYFRVPIVIDDATAQWVRDTLPPEVARCRRLGCVRPKGMKTPVTVSQLLPPESVPGSPSNDQVAAHELAIDAFMAGRWDEALEMFDILPSSDRAKDLLLIFIAENDYEPPDDWDGVIDMPGK